MISLVIVYRLRLLESTLQMTFRELANRPVLLIVLPEANVTITLCANSTPGVFFFFS